MSQVRFVKRCMDSFVHFPKDNVQEQMKLKRHFQEKKDFPNVLGAIDYTHVARTWRSRLQRKTSLLNSFERHSFIAEYSGFKKNI